MGLPRFSPKQRDDPARAFPIRCMLSLPERRTWGKSTAHSSRRGDIVRPAGQSTRQPNRGAGKDSRAHFMRIARMPHDRRSRRVLLAILGLVGVAMSVAAGCARSSNLRTSAGPLPELAPAGALHPDTGGAAPAVNPPGPSSAANPGGPAAGPTTGMPSMPISASGAPTPPSSSSARAPAAATPLPDGTEAANPSRPEPGRRRRSNREATRPRRRCRRRPSWTRNSVGPGRSPASTSNPSMPSRRPFPCPIRSRRRPLRRRPRWSSS